MATTHRTHIKRLESTDAELAVLRDQRTRIDARIATLESARKVDLLTLATDILNGLNLAHVPASVLLLHLTQLDSFVVRDDKDYFAKINDNVDDEKVDVFVRMSRNAGADKRNLLESAGLHWHGRDGGWTGRVERTMLTKLRDVFGDKVERPPLVVPGEVPLAAPEGAVAPAHVDEGSERAQGQPDVAATAGSSRQAASATPVHRISHFRGSFPPRPQAPERSESLTETPTAASPDPDDVAERGH